MSASSAPRWHILVLVALPCLVFAGSLGNSFHLDDFPRIANNPEIDQVWPPWRHFLDPTTSSALPQVVQFRPVLPLSLSLDRAAADTLGLDRLTVLHATNLAIHIASACLLYLLLSQLLMRAGHEFFISRRAIALMASLLYALHPVAGVPINYLCARDLLLMQLALFGSLLAYVRLRGAWRWILHCLLLALSLLSKTNAVAMPLVILCYELTLGGRALLDRKTWGHMLPSAFVVAAFFAYSTLVLGFSDAEQVLVERGVFEYPLTQLDLHWTFYLRNFVWPFFMRPLPQLEPTTSLAHVASWVGLLVIVGSLVLAWRWRQSFPLTAFAIAAYWAMFAPTSSIFSFRLLGADYRQLPSLPWLCLVVTLGLMALPWTRGRIVAWAVLCTVFAGASVAQNEVWLNEETLWRRSVEVGGSSMAHHNYALAMAEADPGLAETHYREALRLSDRNEFVRMNLGQLMIDTGRGEEGLAMIALGLEGRPDWPQARLAYARALSGAGRASEAARESLRAAELDPGNPSYLYEAGYFAHVAGDDRGALAQLERLHSLHGPFEESRFLSGFMLARLRRYDEAIAAFDALLADEPDHLDALQNRAQLHLLRENCADAVLDLERVLALDPSQLRAHLQLAQCYERLEETELAAKHERAWLERPRGAR